MTARNNGIERGGFCDLICSIGASVSQTKSYFLVLLLLMLFLVDFLKININIVKFNLWNIFPALIWHELYIIMTLKQITCTNHDRHHNK
jgi:hypothetical protein